MAKRLIPNPRDYRGDQVRVMERDQVFRAPDFPLGVRTSPRQGLMDYHVHENFSELVLVLDGSGVHEIGGRRYPIRAGDVFLVLGDLKHCYTEGLGLAIVNVVFNWRELRLPQFDLGEWSAFQSLFVIDPVNSDPDRFDHRFRLAPEDFNAVRHRIDDLEMLTGMASPARLGWRFLAISRFTDLIARLLCAYESTVDANVIAGTPHRLAVLAGALEKNYAENITIDWMLRTVGMSYATLFRSFRKYYHDSPVNYLIKQRLRHAEALLRNSSGPSVSEIALSCGFADAAYFSRQFRVHYGCSPLNYRRRG